VRVKYKKIELFARFFYFFFALFFGFFVSLRMPVPFAIRDIKNDYL